MNSGTPKLTKGDEWPKRFEDKASNSVQINNITIHEILMVKF